VVRTFVVALVVVFARPLSPPQSASSDGVTITYLANEGVMLQSGNKKVLIDGLFLKYKQDFAVPADSTQAALREARAPFDSIDLVLVTHHHGDHFHPAPIAAHLRANSRAVLLTSRQVIDSLRGRVPSGDPLVRRFVARTTPDGTRRREIVNGIPVEMLGLRHHDLEHLGYIVEIGGRRVLHVGDTDDAEKSLATFGLDTARIDVALLPLWMVNSAKRRAAIERLVRPKQVIAFHLGDRDAQRAVSQMRMVWPEAKVFSRSLARHQQ
jgi:L-ascorbate metabolism protein UlaG (beta-lactamase superfamily)